MIDEAGIGPSNGLSRIFGNGLPRALVVLMLWCCAAAAAQQRVYPPFPSPSFPRTTVALYFSQSYNSLVSGSNFCTMTLYLNSGREDSIGPTVLKNTVGVKLGATYIDDAGASNLVRVTENDLFAESALIYDIGWVLNPYVVANLRTTVTESFGYTQDDSYRMATFWDPVTSLEGVGLGYSTFGRAGVVNFRLGLALQQIRAHYQTAMTDDPKTRDVVEHYKARTGIEHTDDFYLRLDSVTTYNGRLTLFSSFDNLSEWSVRYEGELKFQFWRFLVFNWRLTINQEPQFTRRTQFNHSLMLGLTHSF